MNGLRASRVSMLLTSGQSGRLVTLTASVFGGIKEESVRKTTVADAGPDIKASANQATRLAYSILYNEKRIEKNVTVQYLAGESLANAKGRSADLAFALAFAAEVVDRVVSIGDRSPGGTTFVATGELSDDGGVLAVRGLPEKLAAVLQAPSAPASFVYPGDNEGDVTVEHRRMAEERGVSLFPVFRLEEAFQVMGIAIWLESPF